MKKYILPLLVLFISNSLFSQGLEAANKLTVRMIQISQTNEFDDLSGDNPNVEGSPYAFEEFVLGSIYENDKLIKENVLLRYNIYSDEIEIINQTNSSEYYALVKNPDLTINILNDVYLFVPFNGSEEKGNYFNVLVNGREFDLYKKSTTTYKPVQFAKNTYDNDRPAKFTNADTFYLVSKDGVLYELPDSKSKFYKVFKSKEKEMKNFAKKAKINFKKEDDIKRLVRYFNTIL